MSAATSLPCADRRGALTVPIVAVHRGRLERLLCRSRRPIRAKQVRIVPANHDFAEVIEDLAEGQRIAIDPALARSTALDWSRELVNPISA